MTTLSTTAAPVAQSDRLIILDSLRGIAVLGILLMNIPGFGLPGPVYGDPSVWNEIGSINYKVWYWIEMTLSGSMRALFSMLFGAGTVLFITRKEKSTGGILVAEYFFRRQLWLLIFALVNAFILLWFWDILFQYAFCGMIIFAFWRLSPRALILTAVICLFIQTIRDNATLYQEKQLVATGEMLFKRDTSTVKLTPIEKEKLSDYTDFRESTSPEEKQKYAALAVEKVTGDAATVYKYQSDRSAQEEKIYTYFYIWDCLIFMFLGMAFFKNGILLGHAPAKTYWLLFIVGGVLGALLTWTYINSFVMNNFNRLDIVKNVPVEIFQVSRVFKSIGVFGAIMLLYKAGIFSWLFKLMRPVGQMAFTNYLAQSLLMGLVFYGGFGFGLFGKLQRYELYYVVALTWVFQIIWSHIWLRYFLFGPLEWTWRSLTYWKRQPMVRG